MLRKVMRDMAPIIDPEEDYLTILAAEEQIAATEARRKKELEDTHIKLKGMSATYPLSHVKKAMSLTLVCAQPSRKASKLHASHLPAQLPYLQLKNTQQSLINLMSPVCLYVKPSTSARVCWQTRRQSWRSSEMRHGYWRRVTLLPNTRRS
jgi:hypothetical protein